MLAGETEELCHTANLSTTNPRRNNQGLRWSEPWHCPPTTAILVVVVVVVE